MKKYIWYNENGEGRNIFGMFRYDFEINEATKFAELNLFADSFYELYINGKYVQFGPVRFDPKYPVYDTHNIKDLLKVGKNTICVLVNSFGCETYKSIVHRAGLIAWGNIELVSCKSLTIESNSTDWLTKKSEIFDETSPKLSFPLNPLEVYNQQKDILNWTEIDYSTSDWSNAVEIAKQDSWGELTQRAMPFMSGNEILAKSILQVAPLKNQNIYSFKIPTYHHYSENKCDYSNFIAFKTYIYSPKKQNITMGLFWGEHYLNGELLTSPVKSDTATLLENYRVTLNEGWNFFFGSVGIYLDEFAFYMILPEKSNDIIVSAEKNKNSNCKFMHSKVIKQTEYDKNIKDKPIPFQEEENLLKIGGWEKKNENQIANNPGRDTDLNSYDSPFEKLNLNNITNHTFKKEDYPNGFAIELELDHVQLLKTMIDIEGVKGATIDLAYSETLNNGRIQLYSQFSLHNADRAICSEDLLQWTPMHPRGFRYIVITVRNTQNDIKINQLKFISANYPVDESASEFECSEPIFNHIWDMCKRTQQIDMEDAFVDCVTRERGMYIRDTIIQYHNNLAFFGDHKLMKRCLELYAQGITPDGIFKCVYPIEKNYFITDFALNMMDGFCNYYEFSGDIELIKKHWNTLLTNLQWFHNLSDEREDGFLDADWYIKRGVHSQYGGLHGDNTAGMTRTGINSMFTFIYLSAIKSTIKMAKALDDTKTVQQLEKRYEKIAEAARNIFWDEDKGAFAETIEKNSFIPHASFLAVLADVPTKNQTEKIKTYLSKEFSSLFKNGYNPDDGEKVAPHFTFYALDALYKLNLAKPAEQIIRDGWGWMLQNNCRTCTEFYRLTTSQNHAWSANPGYYLSKNVLGIKFPEKPNLDVVEIDIKCNSITWANGKFPHPKGNITISWHIDENGKYQYEIDSPKGIKVYCVKS